MIIVRPDKKNNFIHKPINNKIMIQDTVKKPTVILEKVILKPMQILYISDTGNMASLSKVFEKDYGELFNFIGSNGLTPGKVMGFYFSYNDPIVLEVAVEVNKIPAELPGRIRSKIVEGGDAVVAHYTGAYEEMQIPYSQLAQWVTDNNRQANGLPFEVYLNGPADVKDNSELKTDIYQMLK